jgi:hypothetical protein
MLRAAVNATYSLMKKSTITIDRKTNIQLHIKQTLKEDSMNY